MIIYAEVECFFYDTQSLKEKRAKLKSLMTKIRQQFNVSIAELAFQDLWQRTKLGIAIVANELNYAEKVMQHVMEMIDNNPDLERTITSIERV